MTKLKKNISVFIALLSLPLAAQADWTHFGFPVVDSESGIIDNFTELPESGQFVTGFDADTGYGLALLSGDGIEVSDDEISVDMDAVRSALAPSVALNTPTIGSCFQLSATRPVLGSYSVTMSGITAAGTASVFLESFTDSGCTNNTALLARADAGGQLLNQTASGTLVGMVEAGRYAKLRTSVTVGTATFTVVAGNETTH